MGRILGVDFGTVRIGLALSDPSKILASPLTTLQAKKKGEATAQMLLDAIANRDVELIVLGLPLLLSGKDSETTSMVRKFADLLGTLTDIPIILWDERLTSKQVERTLIDGNMRREKRATLMDTLCASLILQGYLDSISNLEKISFAEI